ncbi:MAG: hypothetical protein KDD83_05785, partial [Caldilineaceae bacterium]|nr:hypothetical protein [Caldilineaceae bacterium]
MTPVPTYTVEAQVVRPVLLSPQANADVTAGVVQVTGTSAPNSTVRLLLNGASLGETTADAQGAWQFSAQLTEPGAQELQVQTVAAGGSVVAAEAVTLQVAMPVVEVTPAEAEAVSPSLDLSALETSFTPGELTLRGTGQPGQQLAVLVDGTPAGTATVDDAGTWSLTTALDTAGLYAVSLQASDATGVVATATAVTLEVAAPTAAEAVAAAPTATMTQPAVAATQPVAATQAAVAGAGAAVTEAAAPAIDRTLLMGDSEGDTAFVRVAGTAAPNQSFDILVGDVVVSRATASDDGAWFYVTRLTRPGDYLFRTRSLSGDLSEPARLVLAATPPAPAQPAVFAINADALATPQAPGLVVISGTAPPSSVVDLLLGDVVVGQTTADASGAWQYVLRLTQPGNYTVTAMPRAGAGVASARVNVVAPTAPVEVA